MSAVIRGDIATAAEISFDCIACGLCVARCPSDNVPPNVALLARRLYGKYLAPQAAHLRDRIRELEGGSYGSEIAVLKTTSSDELKKQYAARQIEE
jgi:ferredoxin